jgi:hypothetical protein
MPSGIGRTLLRNSWPNRATTNGSTARMRGLRIVSRPPTKVRIYTLTKAAGYPLELKCCDLAISNPGESMPTIRHEVVLTQ